MAISFFPVTYKMSFLYSFLELGYTIFGLVVSEEQIFIDSSNQNQAMSMKTKFFCRIKKNWGISVEHLTNIIPAKFSPNWLSSFSGEDFKKFQPIRNKNNQIGNAATVFCHFKMKQLSHSIFVLSYKSFRLEVLEEKIFKVSANKNQQLPMTTVYWQIQRKWWLFVEGHTNIIPAQFGSNWPSSFRGVLSFSESEPRIVSRSHVFDR
jgi:hypothetical protein